MASARDVSLPETDSILQISAVNSTLERERSRDGVEADILVSLSPVT
jgi:hypothetical protein